MKFSFSFTGFNFELTPEETHEMSQFLSNFLHKERHSICALLNFSSEFLHRWYDEANDAYTPIIEKGSYKRLTEEERRNILKFITGPECVRIADTLDSGIRRLIKEHEQGKLTKIIKGQETLETIKKICNNIGTFKDFVEEKQQWYKDITDPKDPKDIDIEVLRTWRSRLYGVDLDTNKILLSIEPNLGCNQNDMENLVRKWLSKHH